MTNTDLPERPSHEYLKKLAKERLRDLRRTDPRARLSAAQLEIAREHGFPSWRALKAEVDRRRDSALEAFFAACEAGDVETLRDLLETDPSLTNERNAAGATGLHLAVPHPDAVKLLLERGADPNARDVGDNALPLHFAAGGGHLESARTLLDGGSDVQGIGDLHQMDVIGWATVFAEPHRNVVDLLIERGARHHVFSAIAMGDVDLLRRVIERDPSALRRRLSRFEQEQTALHYVVAPADGLVGGTFRTGDHYRVLEALIDLGADLEATNANGRTPLAIAMLRGDREAMRLLHAAGAKEPASLATSPGRSLSPLATSVGSLTPMLAVSEMEATIAWYRQVGFELVASNGEGSKMDWARVKFGDAEIMFVPAGAPWRDASSGVSLWIRTSRLDGPYALLKRRQLERASAVLAGETTDAPDVQFTADLYTAFYGQREFAIRDPNGVTLTFFQPVA